VKDHTQQATVTKVRQYDLQRDCEIPHPLPRLGVTPVLELSVGRWALYVEHYMFSVEHEREHE